MKSKLITSIFVVLAMAFLFVGCGEVPQAEVDAAKAALDAAKAAEADKYVPDMYNAAKRTLDNAMAMVAEEQDAMFGNFDEATVQLQKAQTDAKSAAAAVPGKKEEVKGEIDALLAQIPGLVNETKMKWKKAPRGKGTHEPLKLIKADIEATEASVAGVSATAESGDLLAAKKQAQDIINKLNKLQAELQ